jgi:hypothetical protein
MVSARRDGTIFVRARSARAAKRPTTAVSDRENPSPTIPDVGTAPPAAPVSLGRPSVVAQRTGRTLRLVPLDGGAAIASSRSKAPQQASGRTSVRRARRVLSSGSLLCSDRRGGAVETQAPGEGHDDGPGAASGIHLDLGCEQAGVEFAFLVRVVVRGEEVLNQRAALHRVAKMLLESGPSGREGPLHARRKEDRLPQWAPESRRKRRAVWFFVTPREFSARCRDGSGRSL